MVDSAKTLEKLLNLMEYLAEPQDFPSISPKNQEYLQTLFDLKLSHSARKTLALLSRNGPQNQRTMAQLLGISPQAVSEMVKKLLQSQCITKVQGNQKNENLISLTELGENIGLLLQELLEQHAREFFSPLSQAELSEFHRYLDKLME